MALSIAFTEDRRGRPLAFSIGADRHWHRLALARATRLVAAGLAVKVLYEANCYFCLDVKHHPRCEHCGR